MIQKGDRHLATVFFDRLTDDKGDSPRRLRRQEGGQSPLSKPPPPPAVEKVEQENRGTGEKKDNAIRVMGDTWHEYFCPPMAADGRRKKKCLLDRIDKINRII
jgi:hypothetical protein